MLAPEAIFHGGEAHLNPAISARDASNAGAPSFDHLGAGWGLLMDCSSEEQTLRAAALAGSLKPPFPPTFVTNPRAYDGARNAPYYQRILDTYDEAKCIELSKVFAKNGTWQTLTLIRLRTQVYGNDPQYRDDPDLAYIDKSTRAIWQQVGDQFDKLPASAVTTLRQFYELQKRVSRLMKQNGVKMMTGSDFSGDMSIWLVPGISLHQEFRELASAGFRRWKSCRWRPGIRRSSWGASPAWARWRKARTPTWWCWTPTRWPTWRTWTGSRPWC